MNFICLIFGSAFLVVGVLFATSNLYKYIKYWKTLSTEEKQKININRLCKNIGIIIGICGLIFLANGLLPIISNQVFTILIVVWFIIAGLDLLFIEKSNRYKNK